MRKAFLATAASLILSGCAAAGSTPGNLPAATAARVVEQPQAIPTNVPLLFVADGAHNRVDIFPQIGVKRLGQITASLERPTALAATPGGTLYVASYGNNSVFGFRLGSTRPFMRISVESPVGLALDRSGDLFVSIAPGGSKASDDAVFEFPYDKKTAAPSSQASRTITTADIPASDQWGPWGLTVGADGDLYIADAWRNGGPCGCLWQLKPGSTKPTAVLPLAPNDVATRTVTVVGRRFEEFYVAETDGSVTGAIGVAIYPPGATQPSNFITAGLSGPTFLTFANDGTLFVSNTYPSSSGFGRVGVVAYRANTFKRFETLTGIAEPEGLATYTPPVKR